MGFRQMGFKLSHEVTFFLLVFSRPAIGGLQLPSALASMTAQMGYNRLSSTTSSRRQSYEKACHKSPAPQEKLQTFVIEKPLCHRILFDLCNQPVCAKPECCIDIHSHRIPGHFKDGTQWFGSDPMND